MPFSLPGPVPCPTALAFSTSGLVLGDFFEINFHLSLPVIFFVLASSPSSCSPWIFSKLLFTVEQFYPSLYYINPLSPFDLQYFGYPYPLGYPVHCFDSRLQIESIQANNFEFYASILPFFYRVIHW
jgi:hypothetical protein